MFALLADGFVTGLMTGHLCAATCAPIFLSFILSREESRRGGRAIALGEFLAGRLVGYAAIGALAGWAGSLFSGNWPWLTIAVNLVLGAALLLYAFSHTARSNFICLAIHRWGTAGRFPLLLGLLTGLNICVPFLKAVKDVMEFGGALAGTLYFVAFFLATSLVLTPMLVLSFGNLLPGVRSVARVLCAAVGLALLCRSAGYLADEVSPRLALAKAVTEAPASLRTIQKYEPVRHIVVMRGDRPSAVVVLSRDLAPEAQGSNGHVPVSVTLDLSGRITDVALLPEHEESPAQYELVAKSDLCKRLIGKTAADPITIGQDVDAVTGATYTSAGIVDAVRLTVRRATERVLPLYAGGAQAPDLPRPASPAGEARTLRFDFWAPGILVLIVLAGVAEWRQWQRLRLPILAVSLGYLGIWRQRFFSVHQVFQMLVGHWPPPLERADWYLVAAAALGSALIYGRIYCGYVCPFGAAAEFLGRLTCAPVRPGPGTDRGMRWLKYAIFVVLALAYGATRSGRVLSIEPFADAFSLGFLRPGADRLLRIGWIALLAVASALVFRFFCRYLCPAGAAMAFLARHRLLGRIRPDRCIECGECIVSCPRRGGSP